MWCECKGFIAILSIILLCVCLVIIGMFIQKESASIQGPPKLPSKEVKINSYETNAGERNDEIH